jgi:hypothetical protein
MAYNGRRGPNVSEYIANLNAIPSAQEIRSNQEDFNIDDDLAMFTNTQFFDFDVGSGADLHIDDINFDGLGGHSVASESIDLKPVDFSNGTSTSSFILRNNDLYTSFYDAMTRPMVQVTSPSLS